MAKVYDSILDLVGKTPLVELKRIEELTEVLRNKRQRIWMDEYKPFGYEILDIRFAGVAVRAKSAANRLTQYIRGEIDCIPEVPHRDHHFFQKLLYGLFIFEKAGAKAV